MAEVVPPLRPFLAIMVGMLVLFTAFRGLILFVPASPGGKVGMVTGEDISSACLALQVPGGRLRRDLHADRAGAAAEGPVALSRAVPAAAHAHRRRR